MNTDRIARLEQLRAELATLLTLEEARTYPTLPHLEDLLEDLAMEAEQEAA